MVRACLRVPDLMGSCAVAIGIILALLVSTQKRRATTSGSCRQFHCPAIGGRNGHPDFHRAPSSCRYKSLEPRISKTRQPQDCHNQDSDSARSQGGRWFSLGA